MRDFHKFRASIKDLKPKVAGANHEILNFYVKYSFWSRNQIQQIGIKKGTVWQPNSIPNIPYAPGADRDLKAVNLVAVWQSHTTWFKI